MSTPLALWGKSGARVKTPDASLRPPALNVPGDHTGPCALRDAYIWQ
jgi:hypothetical protein